MTQFTLHAPAHLIPGSILVDYEGETIRQIDLTARRVRADDPRNRFEETLLGQFEAYFDDPAHPFRLALAPQGSEYQRRVWQALRGIGNGTVSRYGELAQALASGARAVGNACRRNPIPILIPCHRVVAAHGIGGFAGQRNGPHIEQKIRLLRHEGVAL